MNSLLQHSVPLRAFVPIVLSTSIAPNYFITWSIWRVASSILPSCVYDYVHDIMKDMYFRIVVFFFENYAGTEVIFYGDEIPFYKKENVLYISNHQSTVDWVVATLIAIRQGSLGSIRYVLKDSLKYLPFYGFYFPQQGSIFVKRNSSHDLIHLERKMKQFKDNKTPVWLVIFPEGTRFNLAVPEQLMRSHDYALKKNLPPLNHVLTPKTKATEIALETLSDHIDAVYDLTVAYKEANEDVLPRRKAKELHEYFTLRHPEIHVHVRRISIAEIPQKCEERKKWIYEAFHLKDRLLSKFYSEDDTIRGRFPGKQRRQKVPLSQTLPWTVFWASILLPFLATKYGRSLYLKTWLIGGVGTVLYMTILYDRLER